MSWGDEPPPEGKNPKGKWQPAPEIGPIDAGSPRLAVVGEAWRAYQDRIGAWVVALVVVLILETIIGWFASWIVGEDFVAVMWKAFRGIVPSWRNGLVYVMAAAMIQGPFMGGLMRMAIRQWRQQPFDITTLFSLGDVLGPVVRTWVLYVLLVSLGLSLCVVPGVVLAGVLMFAMPLVLDGERSALAALGGSWSLVRGQIVAVTVVHTVLWILFMIGGALCLAGLIVTWPVYVLAIARLHTQRFAGPFGPGVAPAPESEPTTYL
jgi:hypothetical protein